MTTVNDPLIKAEMWEEYLRDHLMVEFGYTEEMGDKIVDKWAHYGHPWFGIKWEDLFEHAYKWANVLHEGIENGEFNVQ